MSKTISFLAFFVCSGLGVASYMMFGITPFLIVYAVCAAANIPGMLR